MIKTMEYHKLSYKKEPDAVRSEPIDLYWIIFNGVKTHYVFDEAALKASSEKDGIYPIVICGCDIIGCGGMYVTTFIDGDDIIWEKFWFGQCVGEPDADDSLDSFAFIKNNVKEKDLIVKPPLRFKLNEYRALADEIVNDLKTDPKREARNKQWYDETLKKYKAGDTARI